MTPATEWSLFVSLSLIAVLGAFRMLRTMSMVRAGIFLMASFCAVAGLMLVLSADLIASMQIMMYVGGMLVMILFMVMMSPDPGGSMMGIAPPEEEGTADEYFCPMHPDVRSEHQGKCPKCGMTLQPVQKKERGQEHGDHGSNHGGMQTTDMDMAMTHEFTRAAAVIGVAVAAALLAVLFTVDWPSAVGPAPTNSAMGIGKELLGRYMIAFEGAAVLIILGMVGAVIFARKEQE